MNANDIKRYVDPWGTHYLQKNQKEAYMRLLLEAYDNQDVLAIKQMQDELTKEQWLTLWYVLASDTRRNIKEWLQGEDDG